MVRQFLTTPVPAEVMDRMLSLAVRAPSAGFSQGTDLLVLEGPAQTRMFFEATSDDEFLADPKGMRELLNAPVIVLPVTDPNCYVARYGEPDKANSSLASLPAGSWPVPYWLVDASFMVMLLLLAATDEGLGALFFRLHRDPAPLLASLGAPRGSQVIGAVALGYEVPGGRAAVGGATAMASVAGEDAPAPSGAPPRRRKRRSLDELVHRGSW